jgi:uncharacterized membrane protein HdeD (DUF308 family)
VSTVQVLALSSLTGAVVGALGILVAIRERRSSSGSGWWLWMVPGVFGVLLCVLSIVHLVGEAA